MVVPLRGLWLAHKPALFANLKPALLQLLVVVILQIISPSWNLL